MNHSGTRRDLLGYAGVLLGSLGFAGEARAARVKVSGDSTSTTGEDHYGKLGVTKIINAAGTYTALTAAIMPMNCIRIILLFGCVAFTASAQQPCMATQPTTSFTIKHVNGHPPLTVDPTAKVWRDAAVQVMDKDCRREIEYPKLKTEIRSFWTDTDLYILFRCPYDVLNLWPADNAKPHPKLWDRDVVEMFIGSDLQDIRRYREFEMAPTGDWIDLAIDLNRNSYDPTWRSGWKTLAHIDKEHKTWYAACRIPLSAIGDKVERGTRWRVNWYRIDGLGPDSQRRFMCWQPTCGSNHVPERFGSLIFK